MTDPTAANQEHARQVRVATNWLTDAVTTLAKTDGTHLAEHFDPAHAHELHRPITQDTLTAAIKTLDNVLAAFRERHLP